MKRILAIICLLMACVCVSTSAHAQLNLPEQIVAGTTLSIPTNGSGDATLYLIGPATAVKRSIQLGEPIKIDATEIASSGRYQLMLRGNTDEKKTFFVTPAQPANIAFLARPSRVPANNPGVVSGVGFILDAGNNLVTTPMNVKFDLAVSGGSPITREVSTRNGIAFTQLDSGKQAGAAQFVASVNQVSVNRVVQQVAAEPCNLRMRASSSKNGIRVETDPVRDCAGNAVPDGTIVTFTSVDPSGRSTIDARIKKGVAVAELPAAPNATISVASGVVVGNEIRWGGRR